MDKKNEHKYQKLFIFLENYLILFILLITLFIFIFNHLAYINGKWSVSAVEYFVENSLKETLFSLKNSLLSISAIFIGIYVTVFTLLGSIKVDSIFAFLNEHTFKKLIKFIRNAFIASFGYIVLVLFIEVIFGNNQDVPYIFLVINMIIVIYMLLTALRFGVILYIAFSKDLKHIQNSIKEHREEINKTKELRFRIEKFLDEAEKEQRSKRNNELNKLLKKRNNADEDSN